MTAAAAKKITAEGTSSSTPNAAAIGFSAEMCRQAGDPDADAEQHGVMHQEYDFTNNGHVESMTPSRLKLRDGRHFRRGSNSARIATMTIVRDMRLRASGDRTSGFQCGSCSGNFVPDELSDER